MYTPLRHGPNMPGSRRQSLIAVQILRAIAALGVALAHAPQIDLLFSIAAYGSAGVDLFFVISGFVIVYSSRNLFEAPQAAWTFMAPRVSALIPSYWAASAFTFLVYGLNSSSSPEISLHWAISTFLFIPDSNH